MTPVIAAGAILFFATAAYCLLYTFSRYEGTEQVPPAFDFDAEIQVIDKTRRGPEAPSHTCVGRFR